MRYNIFFPRARGDFKLIFELQQLSLLDMSPPKRPFPKTQPRCTSRFTRNAIFLNLVVLFCFASLLMKRLF